MAPGTPGAIAAVASAGGAHVVRLATGAGPAAARNAGLAATHAPLVAFVDSDTRPAPGWLTPLLAQLEDPRVAVVAPRIAVPAGGTAVAAYEAARSPLDLGATPGLVGPGRRIGFVPAAALLVRREAVAPDGFDAALRYGEDVDLVWRLVANGWTVRYEPAGVVEHPHRSGARAWLAQRVAYGSSAGPLAVRHPGRLRHVVVPLSALTPWALALAGRPRAALLAAAGATGWASRRLPDVPGARGEILAFAALSQVRLARQVLDAGWRAYPPARPRRGRRRSAPAPRSHPRSRRVVTCRLAYPAPGAGSAALRPRCAPSTTSPTRRASGSAARGRGRSIRWSPESRADDREHT